MPSILLVDDEPGVRSALGGVLRDEGYEVDAVDSGEACLERLGRQAYDVVVLDIWLPGMDGLATFARMPAPRTVSTDLHELLNDVLSLYQGIFPDVDIRRRFAASLPKVAIDVEQIRRVMINLIDNAIEAMEQRGTIEIETQHDPSNNLVRVIVADDGPGIPVSERDKLFLPYYSTKRRGSGLGLAIVRRIVAEHGGSIDLTDNAPKGTRFAVELPC